MDVPCSQSSSHGRLLDLVRLSIRRIGSGLTCCRNAGVEALWHRIRRVHMTEAFPVSYEKKSANRSKECYAKRIPQGTHLEGNVSSKWQGK